MPTMTPGGSRERGRGWKVKLHPVGVGSRGAVGQSDLCLLTELGIKDWSLKHEVKWFTWLVVNSATVIVCGLEER